MPNVPSKGEIEHTCPECGDEFYDNCLKDHEEHLINYVKAWILFWSGTIFVTIVFGVASLHSWALYNGKPGIGIDINHVLTACVVALGGVILWAFPKRK